MNTVSMASRILSKIPPAGKAFLVLGSLLMAILLLPIDNLTSAESSDALEATNNSVLLGLFRQGAPRNMAHITAYEKMVGRKPASVMWYQDFSAGFPLADARKVHEYGAIPHIVWEPWMWGDTAQDATIRLDDLTSGKWDKYMTRWAQGAKKYGHPFFLRFMHEFNIEGYPWGIVNNGRNPEKYVKAWRHVHGIFEKAGAKNAIWVWTFMNESWPQMPWNEWAKAYPGDKYVDWIGIDAYNWGTTQSWSRWRTFTELVRSPAREAWRRYPGKPIMIAEFATTEEGGNKGEWIKNLVVELKTMPYIKAVFWFDEKKEAAWQIKSSKGSLAGYNDFAASDIFRATARDLAQLGKTEPMVLVKRKTASATRLAKPIKVDGSLSDWGDIKPLLINAQYQVQEGTFIWKGPQDLSGKVYLGWDDGALYIAGDITDNKPLVNEQSDGDVWNGDAIEVAISTNPKADPQRVSYGPQDFQIGMGAGNGKTNKPVIWIWQNKGLAVGGQISVVRSGDGYHLEARIPWSNLGGFKPSDNVKVGFEVALDDADQEERQIQMVWNGDFLFYKDPGVWGWLDFQSSPTGKLPSDPSLAERE